MPLFVAIAIVLMSSVLICTKDVASLKFLYSVCSRLYSVCIICDVKSVVSSFVLYSVCIRLYSLVLRLYSVCTPFVPLCAARDVSSLGLLYSVCTPLYSRVLRLYSFVPLGMSFPIYLLCSICTRLYSHPVWRI